MSDEERPWQQQVLIGLGMLVAVGLLVGGVVAWISLKAADVAGISSGGGAPNTAAGSPAGPTGVPPSSSDATTPRPGKQTTGSTSAAPAVSSTGHPSTHHHRKRRPGQLTLTARPRSVGVLQRIYLTGRYPGHDGVVLRVQQDTGSGWSGFPVTVPVNGGSFSTYVQSGYPGLNRFRVVDPGHRPSNPVAVRIH